MKWKSIFNFLKKDEKEVNLSFKVSTKRVEDMPQPPAPSGNNKAIIELLDQIEILSFLLPKTLEEIYEDSDLPNPDIPFVDISKGDSSGIYNNLSSLKQSLENLENFFDEEIFKDDLDSFYEEEKEIIESILRIAQGSFVQVNKWLGIEDADKQYGYKISSDRED